MQPPDHPTTQPPDPVTDPMTDLALASQSLSTIMMAAVKLSRKRFPSGDRRAARARTARSLARALASPGRALERAPERPRNGAWDDGCNW